jgi:hypothetical protein
MLHTIGVKGKNVYLTIWKGGIRRQINKNNNVANAYENVD